MLTLTENASTIVKAIAEQSEEDVTGLRISSDDTEAGFAISTAAQAHPGDQTVTSDGATVFLDESAAVQLDTQVLDGGVDEQGQVQFALAPQG
ncbi:Fe-S cluster assembly protein HesB [Nocardioides acrostichi]|uniref:Fe-S cluster assembly protein HesB n=1 Tax=Nocardioides acrostichi TaxID=2784339 RepID=A0A930YCR1_9ACTN|nr:Fe-S cluster assembly protein HesB [Nocardioides acrostichi]MBF4161694.1 Fe-S cluster assembly protein HesB [Nocardioides acrostichi]